jgi:iron complex outermembrane receptor protein
MNVCISKPRHRAAARYLIAMLVVLLVGTARPAHAQAPPTDLAVATLEDLMNIQITSASRKEQRAEDVPAAVYVITRDDIRRSGMTSVPDLLRLVPGVQVAQINSSKWAVSVRGFNGLYSNKLLVLVDGRSVYNPLFSTAMWDTEDLMLDDVDRIEVIRGPGGAVWGANAVNGVINILTRTAAETSGLLVRAGAGTFERSSTAVRYGGTIANGAYRVYTQLTNHGDSDLPSQAAPNDHWQSLTSGFRGDWSKGPDAFMLTSSITAGQERPLWANLDVPGSGITGNSGLSNTQVGDALARWTHTRDGGATLQLQSYVDLAHRRESIGEYHRHTVDFDADYHSTLDRRHDVVFGGGYRDIAEAMDGGLGYVFNPNRHQEQVVNAFAQDEISLAGRRIALTLGGKIEHTTDEGFSLQPTARVMWNLRPRQHLWAAVSQALRTPSLVDEGIRVDLPVIPAGGPGNIGSPLPLALVSMGNPAVTNERLVSWETGYRLDIGSRAAIDVTGFLGRYHSLQSTEPSAPAVVLLGGQPVVYVATMFQNLLNANTRGAEIVARVTVTSGWQMDGTFSAFHLTPHPDPASRDPLGPAYDGNAPAYQWRGHSAVTLGPRAQADVLLFYVGALGQIGVPAYTRADVRVEWKWTPQLSVVVEGQNLLSASHLEFGGLDKSIVSTQVPRSGGLRFTWRF